MLNLIRSRLLRDGFEISLNRVLEKGGAGFCEKGLGFLRRGESGDIVVICGFEGEIVVSSGFRVLQSSCEREGGE